MLGDRGIRRRVGGLRENLVNESVTLLNTVKVESTIKLKTKNDGFIIVMY